MGNDGNIAEIHETAKCLQISGTFAGPEGPAYIGYIVSR